MNLTTGVTGVNGLDWIIVLAYMLGMVAIGFFSRTKMQDYEDHILSGRSVPTHYLAPCLLTTQIGAGSLMGYVGASHGAGISGAWWVYGNVFTFIIMGLFGAKKIRAAVDAKTLPEFFQNRFGKKSSVFVAVCTMFAELAFTAGQVVGGGLLLSVIMGWDLQVSIIIYMIIVIIYSAVGGLWAVFLTDFVQLIVMVIGLGSLVFFGVKASGGWTLFTSALPADYLSLKGNSSWFDIIASVLYAVPAIFCAFDVVQKYMAAKSPEVARRGSFWAAALCSFFCFVVPMIGMLGYVILGADFANPESITPALITTVLPSGLKGLALAACLSTLMSSTDACLMATSSVFVNDILPLVVDVKKYDEKKMLNISTLWTALFGVLSYVLGAFIPAALTLMEYGWTLVACGAFIPLMGALFWKKTSSFGAFLSLCCGATVGIVWTFLGNPFGVKAVIPSYIVGIIALTIGSLIKPGTENDELVQQTVEYK